MAESGTIQDRMDLTTRLVAEGMGADVCSCYVLRHGDLLELYATFGLAPGAVHKTRLRMGEGLVGHVASSAQALRVRDVWSDPRFVYRPETGEDNISSFIGVPLVRGGHVIGVLAVQSQEPRSFTEIEQEVLETVAMVLAEILAQEAEIARAETSPLVGNAVLPMRQEGTALIRGIGLGTAVYHQPEVTVTTLVAENPEHEIERLKMALAEMQANLQTLFDAHANLPDEYRDIMETFQMFAEDAGWVSRIQEHIHAGLTAEAAVRKVDNDMRLRFSRVHDPYIRERLHDLKDLGNRLLRHLTGQSSTAAGQNLPDHVVLVCRTLGPAELLDYDTKRLRAVILEEGTVGMHAVIIARALDIPVIAQVPHLFEKIAPGDQVIVDADHSQIFVRPNDDVREAILDGLRQRRERLETYRQLRALPATTKDGTTVSLMVNAGLMMDMDCVRETGADGIGLFRTELAFMSASSLPDVEMQRGIYERALDHADGKPVVFRTLDVGGDKLLPYWDDLAEENPAMGWRSTRITLTRPAILRQQLRAMIRAARGRELNVLFPMIATIPEFRAARRILDLELEREASRGGRLPESLRVGSMVEVPSLLWQLPELLSENIDFLSVGSNDLLQFLFAADRCNPKVAERYDSLSAPFLRVLRDLVLACDRAGKQLSICGEMASRPLDAIALVALGFRSLSVTASSLGPVKEVLRAIDLDRARPFIQSLVDQPGPSHRTRIQAFAHDNRWISD